MYKYIESNNLLSNISDTHQQNQINSHSREATPTTVTTVTNSGSSGTGANALNHTGEGKYISFIFEDSFAQKQEDFDKEQKLEDCFLSEISIYDLKCLIHNENQKILDTKNVMTQYLDDYERLIKTTKAQHEQIVKMEEYMDIIKQYHDEDQVQRSTPSSPLTSPSNWSHQNYSQSKLNNQGHGQDQIQNMNLLNSLPHALHTTQNQTQSQPQNYSISQLGKQKSFKFSGIHTLSELQASSVSDLKKTFRNSLSLLGGTDSDQQLRSLNKREFRRLDIKMKIDQVLDKILMQRTKKESKLEVIAELDAEQAIIEKMLKEQLEVSTILGLENTIKSVELELNRMENDILRESQKKLSIEFSSQQEEIEKLDSELRVFEEKIRSKSFEIDELKKDIQRNEEMLKSMTAKQDSMQQMVQEKNLTLNRFQNCYLLQPFKASDSFIVDSIPKYEKFNAEITIIKNPSTKKLSIEITSWNSSNNNNLDRKIIPIEEITIFKLRRTFEDLNSEIILEIETKKSKWWISSNEIKEIYDYIQVLLKEIDT